MTRILNEILKKSNAKSGATLLNPTPFTDQNDIFFSLKYFLQQQKHAIAALIALEFINIKKTVSHAIVIM